MKKMLPKSEFSRNVLTLMTGTTIAQAIPIAIMPILTRMYTPEDFGVLALYMAVVSIISVLATGRYELAIMLPNKDEDALHVATISGVITVGISVIVLIIVSVFNDDIVALFHNDEIALWLYMIPLSILITGFYQIFNYWHNRKKRYLILAKNRIVHSGVVSFSQLGLGSVQQSSGLILGQIVGQAISLGYLVKVFFQKDKKYYAFNLLKTIAIARRYSQFPKIDVPTTVVNIMASQAPNVLLMPLYSSNVAGFFYLTQRVLQVPITLISGSILDVFKQRACEDYKKYGHCIDIFKKTFLLLVLTGLPISIFFWYWIEDIFAWMFGEPWRESGVYAQVLIPALFLRFVANPLSFMFYIAEKQVYNLIGMFFLLFSIVVGLMFSSSSLTSIISISVSYCVVYLFYIVLSARFSKVL